MRIGYGVMGYGRGHAMRALAVLPALQAQHEVTFFAGGDAYPLLAARAPTVRIPTLGYRYDDAGRHSPLRTVRDNVGAMADLLGAGPASRAVTEGLRARGIELVISDSEAWTHRAAQRLGLPRIGFDHIGIIAYCAPHFPPDLWLAGRRDGLVYRQLMGLPDEILITSFYAAEPRYPNVRLVGPMLGEDVLAARPTRGSHLLCYFNQGQHQFLPQLERSLRLLDLPVIVYGTPQRGQRDNLHFRAPSRAGFLEDLASCRALLSTAGNGLIGEAVYLGKPILALPEDAFEQRLNAHLVERLGIGRQGDLRQLAPADVDVFLGELEGYRSRMAPLARNGRAEAIAALLAAVDRLGRRGSVIAAEVREGVDLRGTATTASAGP